MYYTDSEIYQSVRRGVPFVILAQLNGCGVNDIKAAYNRVSTKIRKKDLEYKKVIESSSANKSNNAAKGDKQPVVDKNKFRYTEEMNSFIATKLQEGMKYSDIYKELFVGLNNKPSLQSFRGKCSRVKSSIQSNTTSNPELLEIQQEIDKLTSEYQHKLCELLKRQIELTNQTEN